MDAAEEVGGTASRHGPLSRLAHDQGAADDAERGCVGGDGTGLHGRQWQRHFASFGKANLLPSASQDHGDDRRQGTRLRILLANAGARLHRRARGRFDVVYDARGHFEEPHTNRRIGCGTIEVGNYLHAMQQPEIVPGEFADASIEIIGPSGNFSAILFCEKEGFAPLFKAVNLANRYDLMIILTKGVSVTAARQLIDNVCGDHDLPLFVLHDFDVAGFLILGTLQRHTRRYQFCNAVETIDLGLRLAHIVGLEREPAAATRTSSDILRAQLAENGATDAEIDILLSERVELNAMTSDALIEMIERRLKVYGVKKVVPDGDLLGRAYRAFHHSQELREKFGGDKG
jgi:hypothetical protein